MHNDPTASIKKAGIITAEIITEPEIRNKNITNKRFKIKVTSPVTLLGNRYGNVTIVDLGDLPVVQISEQSFRDPGSASPYSETGINVEIPEVVQNNIAMKWPDSFYGNDLARKIKDSVEKVKIYPRLARMKGIEGEVQLRFRVMPDGMIEEIEIVKGSGFEILDKVSVETIKRSAPLPYIKGWIEIPLVFRLE